MSYHAAKRIILYSRHQTSSHHQTNSHHPTRRVKLSQVSWSIALILAIPFSSLAVSLFVSPAWAQTRPAIVQEGYTLLDRGWVNDAIATFRQAVQRYPQSVEARLGLAIAYQRAGQDASAWEAYQQVLAQDPENRSALTAVGLLGGYRSEWQQLGIEALTTLLNLMPGDNAARGQRALLYGYQGQFAAAMADYDLVLANNPTPEILLGAAQTYTYSGDYEGGLALFERYLATGNTISDSAITAYAQSLQETGNADEAVRILEARSRSQTTLNDTAIQIRAALAAAYQANQQPEQALTVLESLRGEEAATLPLARSLSAIGRQTRDPHLFEEAVVLYRQVLERPNPSPGLLIEIADVFSETEATQSEALQLYQQLTALQPDNQSLQVKRSVLEYQLGQLARSDLKSQLAQVLQPLPTAPGERRSLAQALLRLDPPEVEFLPIYQSLQQNIDDPFFNFRLAQIFIEQNQLLEARAALSAYATSPEGADDPASELVLAEIERREGNLTASAAHYEALIDRDYGEEIQRSAMRGLAGIRLAQRQPEDALEIYNQLLAINPDDAEIQLGQAAVAYQLRQISQAEAEATLDRWLNTQPNVEPPPELFALVGVLPADPQRETLYDTLLAIDPDNIAINRRWIQLWAVRDPARAQARVDELKNRNPEAIDVYFVQGELAQQLGDLNLAGQSYEVILAEQPDNTDALSALGGVRFEQRRFADATLLYQRVLALQPNDQDAERILAELSAAQDKPLSALQQFTQLQNSQAEPDPTVDDRIRDIQVDFLRRRGFQPYWERY